MGVAVKKFWSRKLALFSSLALAGVGLTPATADSTNVFSPGPVQLGAAVPNGYLLDGSLSGDDLYLAEYLPELRDVNEAITRPSQGGILKWDGASSSWVSEIVTDVHDYDQDGDDTDAALAIGYTDISVSDDGTVVAAVSFNEALHLKVSGVWGGVGLLDPGFMNLVAVSGDGNVLYAVASEPTNYTYSEIWGLDLSQPVENRSWVSLGVPHRILWTEGGHYSISTNSDGSKLLYTGYGIARVLDVDPAAMTVGSSLDVFVDLETPDGVYGAMSSDGSTMALTSIYRGFVAISTDSGRSFSSIEPDSVFGPGFPNLPDADSAFPSSNNRSPASSIDISSDGSHISILSGEYFGLTVNQGQTWATVFSGGFDPFNHVLAGETGLITLVEDADTSTPDRVVTRSALTSADSGSIPSREMNGSVPLPTKEFLGSQLVKQEATNRGDNALSIGSFDIGASGNPVAISLNSAYEWSPSGWLEIDRDSDTAQADPFVGREIARVPGTSRFVTWSRSLTDQDPNTSGDQFDSLINVIEVGATPAAPISVSGGPAINADSNEEVGQVEATATELFFGGSSLDSFATAAATPLSIYNTATPGWSTAEVSGAVVLGDWLEIRALNGTSEAVWAATSQGEVLVRDAGTWASVTLPDALNNLIAQGGINSFSVGGTVPNETVAIVAGGFDTKAFISNDGGTNFSEVTVGSGFDHVEVSEDGQNIAFFSNFTVGLSTDAGATFELVATTPGVTKSAIFYLSGSDTRLLFGKERAEAQVNYAKFIDTSVSDANLAAWSGGFSTEPAPVWGTKIWDQSSFYVPNHMFADLNGTYTACDDGIGAGTCSSLDFSSISTADLDALIISGKTYLEPCFDPVDGNNQILGLDTFCIESVRVAGSSGTLQNATQTADSPTGGFSWGLQTNSRSGYPDFNLRPSGQPSVWDAGVGAEHSGGGTTYSVNAVLDFSWSKRTGLLFPNYAATVIPVAMVTGTTTEYPDVVAQPMASGFSWSGDQAVCAWNESVDTNNDNVDDQGVCAERHEFLAGSKVEISVRLPKTMAGWYKGRVFNPEISAVALEDTPEGTSLGITSSDPEAQFNRVTVVGEPAIRVPYLDSVDISFTETPLASRGFAMSLLGKGGQIISDSDASTVKYINGVKQASNVNNRANAETSVWQFSTLALPQSDRCYSGLVASEGPGVIVGMVSTDSMAYSGKPPVFKNGALNYSVAGLHEYLDGTETRAKYSLTVREAYARCAYNILTGDLDPSVSVFETSDGTAKTGITFSADTFTSQGDDWWKVNVSGITFSNPTIAVTLTGGSQQQNNDNNPSPPATGGVVATPVATAPEPVTPPSIPAGQFGAVLIGGQPANVTIAPSSTKGSLEIKGDNWALDITPSSSGDALNADGELVLNPQLTTDVSGSGFQAGSKASAFLLPSGASQVAALGVTQANLRAMTTGAISLGEISVSSTGTFTANLDLEGVAAGDYVLQVNGAAPDGKIRSISIRANIPDTALKGWTKKISDTQVKVYVKNVVRAGKVQIFVNGEELAWINAGDDTDRKLRFAQGFNYLVRTVNLEPGKNRLEIRLDGERIRFNTYSLTQ